MGILELVRQHLIEEVRCEAEQIRVKSGMSRYELAYTIKVISNLLKEKPECTDEEIAYLVEMPASFIKLIRARM